MMTDAKDRLMTEMKSNALISESYRGLRSSISFAAVDAPIKTLLVSSSNKGEGKSLTSVNLAIAMAMDRRRVILVDADLRRPNIHRLLHLEQTPRALGPAGRAASRWKTRCRTPGSKGFR